MSIKIRFLDAIVQMTKEIKEIMIIAAFLSMGLIINMPALQSILMMGVTYLVSLALVGAIFLILAMEET